MTKITNSSVGSLADVFAEIQSAKSAGRGLDAKIEVAMRWVEAARLNLRPDVRAPWKASPSGRVSDPWIRYDAKPVTSSLEAAVQLVERMLPGWWWSVGTCCVSDDANLAPDFNSPEHGARLKAQLMPIKQGGEFDASFDVDRRPPGNVPLALLEALFRALIALESTPTNPRALEKSHG